MTRNIALGMIALLCSASTMFARTPTVPSEYPTIQSAITAAIDNDEIVIEPGTYFEWNLYMNEDLIIRSTNPQDSSVVNSTIIDAAGHDPIFYYTLNVGGEISGLTIQNANTWVSGGAITMGSGCSTVFTHCVVVGNQAPSGGAVSVDRELVYTEPLRFVNTIVW